MARTLSLMIAFTALIGSGVFLYSEVRARSAPPEWPALEDSGDRWLASRFSAVGDTRGDHFDFSTGVITVAGSGAAARLAVHYKSPDDCLYLEIVGRNLSLVAAQGGLHRTLSFVQMAGELSPGKEHAVELRRRASLLVVVIDGQVRARAFAEGFSGGQAAIGVSDPDAFKFTVPSARELEPVLYMDDFMRSEKSASPWKTVTGVWENKGLRNPSMSANAFRYSGSGSPALTVTGESSWDMYSYAASFQGAAGGKVGLAFNYRDKDNYYLFRWSAREKPRESSRGLAELVKVAAGRETVVQRGLVGYLPEQWYRAEVRLGFGWAEVYVDEQMILGASDPTLTGGQVGLWAHGDKPARFDDVKVGEATFFCESFDGPASTWRSWDFLGGEWALADGQDAQGLKFAAGETGAVGVFGSGRWGNYIARAEILPRSGRVGLVYHYRDATSYSCLSYDTETGRLELASVSGGKRKVLDSRSVKLAAEMHIFEVFLDRGLARARVDGRHELSAWQTDSKAGGSGLSELGRVGLGVWGGRALARSVSVELSGELEPLSSINPIFATDREMVQWSSWKGDWAQTTAGSKVIRWHRARFSGDVKLLVEVNKFLSDDHELALSVGKSGAQGKANNGYILRLVSPVPAEVLAGIRAASGKSEDKSKDKGGAGGEAVASALILTRDGKTVAQSLVPKGDRVWTLALRKAGPFLLGYVNSRQVLMFMDDRPLTGRKVAWFSRGVKVEDDGFRVYSPAAVNYPFSKAPSDWRVASGIWSVTNRWQCDPRWSFFSGYTLSHQERLMTSAEQALPADRKLQAVLWNKRQYGDNVVVEFFAGIKMNRRRGGRYGYARDINCTLSADGKDLSSGYSFLFGGFDNDHSAILRKGKEVKRTASSEAHRIPRKSNIHHRWFYVRAERKGNKLHFTVDGGRVVDLEYTDPDPLPGRHLAIWTWDCGIMISRVRISGAPSRGYEPIDFVPGKRCASPYPDPDE
jgi:hypothetical protein